MRAISRARGSRIRSSARRSAGSLAKALGADPDLVETACLAHDIGHPPFGHNGESALDDLARACGGFEGNAQSLRLLTRLEAKVITAAGRSAGLNLTRGVLDAALKYPWLAPAGAPSRQAPRRPAPPAGGKYGAYAEDGEVFGWVRDGAPRCRPCLEAQIMDWADDVAYSVHDLEDGLHAGHITLRQLRDESERLALAQVTAATYADPEEPASEAELCEVLADLLAPGYWPGSLRWWTALARRAEESDQRADRQVLPCRAERDAETAHGGGPLTRYGADLIVPRRQRLECALLKGVTAHYVMSRPGVGAVQERQRELIAGLAEAVARGAPATLDPALRPAWMAAPSDASRLRVVVDQIASLTDTSAVVWHRRLCGAVRSG